MKKNNQKTNSYDGTIMDIACADIINKKIYVTSGTMKRSMRFGSASAKLINEFKATYPSYKVEVNDAFFLLHLNVIPA